MVALITAGVDCNAAKAKVQCRAAAAQVAAVAACKKSKAAVVPYDGAKADVFSAGTPPPPPSRPSIPPKRTKMSA